MSDHDVDLSSIRGDWYFHMNYLLNAVEKTQKHQMRVWRKVKAAQLADGSLPEDANDLIDEFTEAVRMTHSFMDDFAILRETRPPKKKAKKKARKKAKKKARKKVAKKASKKVSKKTKKKAAKKATKKKATKKKARR